ncbi:MAG: hypothetical protein PWR03_2129 [Tenuifilum sp.]|jgi:acyl-ACP thioesterase|uniref:acyl-[acyl-carrier-protein] thioesterase n=1 Tax=Tenuifilum sp. TaxID=2760880 RepID=UPI0024AB72C6|nr:acyl-ACP thioesterase domain-containing protein [Tenuifilum sp.]MDI3527945.1 hypothetical protein [Tenuifilum sp.]
MVLSSYQLPKYHKHSIRIHSYEVDFNQKLTVTALFNYFQEIAWEHAHILGYGFEHLLQKGLFWVLSRVEAEIYRLPRWTEQVTLLTWPRGSDGIFAFRDFEMYDECGKRIIAATSSWLVLNAKSHRPVRINWFSDFDFAQRNALDRNAAKLLEAGGVPDFSEKISVRIGDIDMNQHVNNVRYIDWAYNTFSIEHFKNFYPARVAVNFNAEAKAGDLLAISLFQDQNGESLVDITSADNNKNLCRLMFYWKKIS